MNNFFYLKKKRKEKKPLAQVDNAKWFREKHKKMT